MSTINTLEDLKTGMIVEQRCGDRKLVLLDFLGKESIIVGNTWGELTSYKNDLTHKDNKSRDIIKVYENKSAVQTIEAIQRDFDISQCDMIWERKEVTELTLEDVAKKFNIPVENLRIKD